MKKKASDGYYFENKNTDNKVVRFIVDENSGYFQDDAKVQ